MREQRVLLGAVEAVHLVEEQDRAPAVLADPGRARSAISRTSFTPAVTADSGSNAFSVAPATRRAMVVLPVPGGPHSTTDESRSASMSTRSGRPGPRSCSWPTTSSRDRGRRRAASGARRSSRSTTAALNRSSATARSVRLAVNMAFSWIVSTNGAFGRIVDVGVALGTEHQHVDGDVAGGSGDHDRLPPRHDRSRFEESFEELYARAYGVAYQLLGRRSEAEDVAQETLARAFVRWPTIRSYAEAWVVRVAGNLAIDGWRRSNKIDGPVERSNTASTTTPGPDPGNVSTCTAPWRLSRRQREVLVLRFLADLPEADVAKALGCSVGSVKQRASERAHRVAHHHGLVVEETSDDVKK